jgi:hypothetical protein
MSLRQRIASDLASGNLTHNWNRETGADRIAALAWANRLGATYWRILAEHDSRAMREAIRLLARKMRHARWLRDDVRSLLCRLIVEERLADKCKICQGRGFIVAGEEVHHTCPACDGMRIGYHSDTERQRKMGVGEKFFVRVAPLFAEGHEILADADLSVERQVARKLGRR